MSDTKTPLSIFIIIEKINLPSSRIRFVQIRALLDKLGAEVEMVEYPRKRSGLLRMMRRMNSSDLVVLQKKLPNPLESLIFKLFSKCLVYDFDDAVCFRHLPKDGSYRSRSREIRFNAMISRADAVICGNDYLASLVSGKKPIHIYPSPVPTEVAVKNYLETDGIVRLGWVGLGSNLNSLERIIPALKKLSLEIDLELVIISDRSLEIEGVNVKHRIWSLEKQEHWISELDIGLMPLDAESPFDKGKCSYKLLQYMASGVIPAADAVGMNESVIRDDENGRLVYNGKWYPVLKDLALSATSQKTEMGRKARETVLHNYDYPSRTEALYRFLQKVVSGKSV